LLASGSNSLTCNKQTDVALCSSDSEYKDLFEAVTEAIWLCQERKETRKNVRVLIIGVKSELVILLLIMVDLDAV
jgi:hypothetical protein